MDRHEDSKTSLHQSRSCAFVKSLLPLYHGPFVTIRIGSASHESSASHEYKLSKELLCRQSPYFAKAFEGNFREAEEQSITLYENDDVVTVRSIELLIQWLYIGNVHLGDMDFEEEIDTMVEFLRLADMCGVIGMESLMTVRIKAILEKRVPGKREPNTHYLTSKSVVSATFLPNGHPVRTLFADAAVAGYFGHCDHKFAREAKETAFGCDLLYAVRRSLKGNGYAAFVDPITGCDVRI